MKKSKHRQRPQQNSRRKAPKASHGVLCTRSDNGKRVEGRMISVAMNFCPFADIVSWASHFQMIPDCASCGAPMSGWKPDGPHATAVITMPEGNFGGIVCDKCVRVYQSDPAHIDANIINGVMTEEFGATETQMRPACSNKRGAR